MVETQPKQNLSYQNWNFCISQSTDRLTNQAVDFYLIKSLIP